MEYSPKTVMRKTFIEILLTLLPLLASAQVVYKLKGKIGDKYSIIIELRQSGDGLLSGQYAYLSTLRKNGDVDCSWLQISPSYESPYSAWSIINCKFESVEDWYNVTFKDRKHLTARIKNAQGDSYGVTATVVEQRKRDEPLNSYFKQHIGEMVEKFDMFNDIRIKERLQYVMGTESYFALKEIYQVQGPFEYRMGMFCGAGFMAHQCCDLATVWAYDTDNNSFYIWIRKDSQDYWWSESGNVPYKFRELVNDAF